MAGIANARRIATVPEPRRALPGSPWRAEVRPVTYGLPIIFDFDGTLADSLPWSLRIVPPHRAPRVDGLRSIVADFAQKWFHVLAWGDAMHRALLVPALAWSIVGLVDAARAGDIENHGTKLIPGWSKVAPQDVPLYPDRLTRPSGATPQSINQPPPAGGTSVSPFDGKRYDSSGNPVVPPESRAPGSATTPRALTPAEIERLKADQKRLAPATTTRPSSAAAPRPTYVYPSAPVTGFQQSAAMGRMPGGISLSRAAAERMPLGFTLEGAYVQADRLVLSGRRSNAGNIDAALLLTAVRATCEGRDPHFSLDPDNPAAWNEATRKAGEELRERIARDLGWKIAKGVKRTTPSILKFRTISARRDYPAVWRSISAKYPEMRSRLVFHPIWLKETRLGEILYKADVLLKELAAGAPALEHPQLRASDINDYRSATERSAAMRLLERYHGITESNRNNSGRIWFDLTESSQTTADPPDPLPAGRSELRRLLDRKGLLHTASSVGPASFAVADGAMDLSEIFPRMYVRVVDPVTNRDTTGYFRGINEMARQANADPRKYAKIYPEYQALVEVFRAYVVAVQLRKVQPRVCASLPKQLTEAERIKTRLPDYHATEFGQTVAWYEYTDGKLRRAIAGTSGLFQGGVSVGVTRYLNQVPVAAVETPIIRELKAEAIAKPVEQVVWSAGTDRHYIVFALDTGQVGR